MCPSYLLQGTGKRVEVAVVLVSGFPQVQDDGGWAALRGEVGEIPERGDEDEEQDIPELLGRCPRLRPVSGRSELGCRTSARVAAAWILK